MLRKQPTAHQEVPAQVTQLLSFVCFCSALVHGEKVLASLLLLEASEGSVKAAARRTRGGRELKQASEAVGRAAARPEGSCHLPSQGGQKEQPALRGRCSPDGNLPSKSLHAPSRATLRQPLVKTTLRWLFLHWNADNLGSGFPSHRMTRQNSFFLFKSSCAPL